jgi:hypothetical protein
MAGSLLVSGNPQHYKAIGEGGQPVYSVAFQLREAIRLKAGSEVANCLAIPQSNQHGSMVDWYSPTEGDVVPWSAATSLEREHALAKLDLAYRKLDAAISKLTLSEARNGQAAREKNTVLPLMSKVFFFPDTNFIYLVNGEPVIAFWGFHAQGAGLPSDPFVSLRPIPAVAASTAAAPVLEQANRHRWWWWLLLLLLLLLLFFLLRGCAPGAWFNWGQGGVTTAPNVPTQIVPPDRSAVVPPVAVDSTPNAQPGGWIDRGVSGVRRWWSGNESVDGVAQEQATVPGTQGDTPVAVDPTTDTTSPQAEAAMTPEAAAPTNEVSESPAANDPLGSPPSQAVEPVPPPVEPNPNGANQANPTLDPTRERGSQRPDSPLPTTAPQGRPMTIPPQAINSGDTRFLNGNWTAGTGIQDAKTGKPLRIDYDFSQGNGQGKVTIRRADGSQCVGAVSAQMQGKSLQINDQGVAKCSDGGTIALPKVTCVPQPNGQANCQGRYQNGVTFPVSMRHAPK